ncbi:hypothetical protein [uncultured Roseibium sp.]|uniref:hypothetical protein n=1 Tax=uncultured Roseibium sp. TaxID=1936171 RepID=UPI002606F177|nr:hypothetical protein [uncultured Roseibium sp.]
MSEKDHKSQELGKDDKRADSDQRNGGQKTPAPSREDRLAEALRANLRRRKSAAKTRQKD